MRLGRKSLVQRPPTSWNRSDTSALHSFSNDGLTLTRITTNNQYAMTRACHSRSFGKFYYELKFIFTGTGMAAGISNSALALDHATIFAGSNSNAIIVGTNSLTTFNNANIGSSGTVVTNQWMGFAIDLSLQKWWTIQSGGNWNNDTAANQDPSKNVGGYSFAGIAGSTWFPIVQSYRTSDHSSVVNFGTSDFVFAVPSGFKKWLAT